MNRTFLSVYQRNNPYGMSKELKKSSLNFKRVILTNEKCYDRGKPKRSADPCLSKVGIVNNKQL